MNHLKSAVQELKKKTLARIKRAEALVRDTDPINRKKANNMINAQWDEIATWDKSKIMAEFIDPQELLIREVLNKIGC